MNINTGSQSVTFGNAIDGSNTAGLTVLGGGTLTLGAANGYTGGTTINAGTLVAANASGSATGTGAVVIGTAATLGGAGFINAGSTTVSVSGTIAPNTGTGSYNTLTLTAGTVQFYNGATLNMNFGAANLGTSDQIVVNGNLGLPASGTVGLTVNGGAGFGNGTYDFLNYSGAQVPLSTIQGSSFRRPMRPIRTLSAKAFRAAIMTCS